MFFSFFRSKNSLIINIISHFSLIVANHYITNTSLNSKVYMEEKLMLRLSLKETHYAHIQVNNFILGSY